MADSASSSSARATHPRLHIRNANDAHTLFEAVRLNKLPIVRRRLSPTERELQSGEVFVWEEASYKGGLERWTDGRKWSQSRMREPFLFYEEKVMPSREEKDAKAARRARKSSDPSSPMDRLSPTPSSSSASSAVAPFRRQDRPTKIKGLTKQTYSAYVTPPGSTAPPKKWHLTAYFCTTDYHELPVVTQDPTLRNIQVPKGVYVTGKGLTRKSNRGVGSNSSNAPSTSSSSTAIADDDKSFGSPAISIRSSFDSPAIRPSSLHCPPLNANDSPATTAYVPATTPPSLLSLPPSVPTSRPGEEMDRCSPPPRWSSTPTPPPQQYGVYNPHAQQPYYPPPPQPHYSPYSYDHSYHPSPSSYESAHQLPPLTHQPSHSSSYHIPPILDTPQPKQYGSSSPVMPSTYPGPSSASAVGYPSSDVRGEYYSPTSTSGSPSTPSGAAPKYLPRSLADERALGAFRIAL